MNDNKKTLAHFEFAFEDLMEDALNSLSPAQFERFKDNIQFVLEDYDD